MKIPLVDLRRQYPKIKQDIDKAVTRVLKDGNFILGNQVEEFEAEFAKYCQRKYCIGVASGSDALLLSLRALGIKGGDEVITPANTFISTVFPIMYLGAKPVFVDIKDNYQIDPKKIEEAISAKTKVILPVHLFGIPAPMDEILKIAKKYKLFVLEDAAQAHGASVNSKKCGSFGDLAAFSFYPGKNLGAGGDAGAIVTNNKKLSDMIRKMRNIGQSKKYIHQIVGYNSRLDTIQAAILLVKLKELDSWNKKRNQVANLYNKLLANLPIKLPPKLEVKYFANYHLYVIRTKKRDQLMDYLKGQGIYCGIHYPLPVHLQESTKQLNYRRGDFPITEQFAKEILSLPIFPELSEKEVKYISSKIRKFVSN